MKSNKRKKSTKSELSPAPARLIARLRQGRIQLSLLGGLLGALVLAIVLTDLATGGDTEPPSSLGSTIMVTPGTRVVIVPTLLPVETPTPEITATATPSSEAEALARDAERLSDLALLQAAQVEYRDRFHKYPSTGGQVQTLCHFPELDKGCDLKKVLDADEEGILEDPLGGEKGYWYASDGQKYTIWMLREGPGNPGDPVCLEVVPHLRDRGALFCVTVGASP